MEMIEFYGIRLRSDKKSFDELVGALLFLLNKQKPEETPNYTQ